MFHTDDVLEILLLGMVDISYLDSKLWALYVVKSKTASAVDCAWVHLWRNLKTDTGISTEAKKKN